MFSASALLALGASLTSFAASKGTWMMVDGEWYCYDKNGDAYTNVFCSSNGKEYYVGDDGQLVRSEWVEYDGNYYFVNSSGAKITNDWRLTTPYDDDTADEEWYYFKSNGKKAENENIACKGKACYFDTGRKMLLFLRLTTLLIFRISLVPLFQQQKFLNIPVLDTISTKIELIH